MFRITGWQVPESDQIFSSNPQEMDEEIMRKLYKNGASVCFQQTLIDIPPAQERRALQQASIDRYKEKFLQGSRPSAPLEVNITTKRTVRNAPTAEVPAMSTNELMKLLGLVLKGESPGPEVWMDIQSKVSFQIMAGTHTLMAARAAKALAETPIDSMTEEQLEATKVSTCKCCNTMALLSVPTIIHSS